MKKLVSLFLCAVLCTTLLTPALAEAFDPCANTWALIRGESTKTYPDGTVETSSIDYRLPAYSWNLYRFNEDGSLKQDVLPAIGDSYTNTYSWERVSDTKLQYTRTIGEQEQIDEWEYVNGELVMTTERQYEEYTLLSKVYLSDDEEAVNAVSQAAYDYSFVDEYDTNVTEGVFMNDFVFTSFLDYTLVLYFGLENPSPTIMGENGNGWTGSVKWLDSETVSLELDCRGELLQVNAKGTGELGKVSDNPGMIFELTDETGENSYVVSITKMANKETFYLEFHNDSGVPVIFQVVPAWKFD